MRLPSHLRLKQASEFALVKEKGTSKPGRYLVLSVLPVPQVAEFGFGLVTGRKIGGAVQRNRVRRLLREIIRAHRAEIQPGWHIVTIARWRAPEASYHELESDWLHLAKKLGILRKAAPSPPIAPTAPAT